MILNALWSTTFGLSCIILSTFTKEHHNWNNCITRGVTLICDHDIPDHIPNSVTEVYIVDYNKPKTKGQTFVFKDAGWISVEKFDITVNADTEFEICDNDYFDLNHLTTLGVHSPKLRFIGRYGFAGLQQLIVLDLSGCECLKTDAIIQPLIINNSTPKLRTLDLRELTTRDKQKFIVSEAFMELIVTKKIESLSLRGCNILVTDTNVLKRTSLQSLDISNTTITDADLNENEVVKDKRIRELMLNIKTLNISNSPFRSSSPTILKKRRAQDCSISKLTPNLEELDISFTFSEGMDISNYINGASNCTFNLKVIHAKGNYITKINGTILSRNSSAIQWLDLSFNKISYFALNISSLKTLSLSSNSLFEMEILPEFPDFLSSFRQLQHIDLSYNKLTHIPYHMFDNNGELRTLDLKGNYLESITFQMTSLVRLNSIDLRYNQIKFLNDLSLSDLKNLFQMVLVNKSTTFEIDFRGNPLKCTCDSINFLKWLESDVQPYMQVENKCTLDGKTVGIDKNTVRQTEYLCIRPRDMVITVVAASVLLSFIIFTSVIVIKKVRKSQNKSKIKHFIAELKNKKLDVKELVFLSYCCEDGDLVLEKIYPPIKSTLKEMTGLTTTIVCHGEADFRPGLSIVSEIMRCVSECCVIIFVVSRAFCASNWCRLEVKEAYALNKPIILIFKENIKKNVMPIYLQRIFERYTRVRLLQVDGKYELVPSFQRLCESIILLAGSRQDEKKHDEKNLKRQKELAA